MKKWFLALLLSTLIFQPAFAGRIFKKEPTPRLKCQTALIRPSNTLTHTHPRGKRLHAKAVVAEVLDAQEQSIYLEAQQEAGNESYQKALGTQVNFESAEYSEDFQMNEESEETSDFEWECD